MSVCDHIQAGAAGLAALPPGDVERDAAFEHARTCPACARALGEGVALLGLLEVAAPATALRPDARARAAATIRTELRVAVSRSRARAIKVAFAILLAVLAAWLLPLGGGRRLVGSPGALASVLMIGAAALATVGGIALWRPLVALVPLTSVLASSLSGRAGSPAVSDGLHCLAFELMLAMLPLATAFIIGRRSGLTRPGLTLAVAAGSGALAAQAVLEITCHATRTHLHLLVFHSGGVFLALLLGAIAGHFLPTPLRGSPETV